MIRHHLPDSEKKSQIKFEMDEKKLVKSFIYHKGTEWIEYFTGFLFMDVNKEGNIDIKIRFSRHPHLAEIEAGVRYPLELHTDQQGLYTVIQESRIKSVEKPEQNLLYLKLGDEGRIFAISFHSKAYCKALLEHFTLVLESQDSNENTFSKKNLQFLAASISQNLIYVDLTFMQEEKIDEFLDHFNKVDMQFYLKPERNNDSEDEKNMALFFQIVKNVFLRANQNIIMNFISKKKNFETLLKCLSCNSFFIQDNTFGMYHFNYFEEFKEMTVIHADLLDFEDSDFHQQYELITRIKFLKDVAICTFIEISTEAVFNDLITKAQIQILSSLADSKNKFMQKIRKLAHKDEYKFICVFCEVWEVFKAVLEDNETLAVKEMFYFEWIQNGMFSQTLSAMGRLLKNQEISSFHPRFWQKWLDSMNPMMSYEWSDSQKMVLYHQTVLNQNQTIDLMGSLIMILANGDCNTKILVLDFVRVQIEVSQNRKKISAKYLSYIYRHFVSESYPYCINQADIDKFIEFVQKIYVAQPVRTRHSIIECNIMSLAKPYLNNKFTFIMTLKLLNTFIEVEDNDIFRYLSMNNFYDCLRSKYAENQRMKNIINSLFMVIFKATQTMKNKQGKKYIFRIFFGSQLQRQPETKQKQQIQGLNNQKNLKRAAPSEGFEQQIDIQK